MKIIKFKNDWRYSRKGDVIEEGDGVAQLLIARGIAEEVKPAEKVTANQLTGETDLEAGASGPNIVTRRIPGPNELRSGSEPTEPHADGGSGGAQQYPGRRGGRG